MFDKGSMSKYVEIFLQLDSSGLSWHKLCCLFCLWAWDQYNNMHCSAHRFKSKDTRQCVDQLLWSCQAIREEELVWVLDVVDCGCWALHIVHTVQLNPWLHYITISTHWPNQRFWHKYACKCANVTRDVQIIIIHQTIRAPFAQMCANMSQTHCWPHHTKQSGPTWEIGHWHNAQLHIGTLAQCT